MNSTSSTYRIIALVMALLMLATSVGLAVDMHYCQGQLKSVNLFGKANACCNETAEGATKSCSSHQKKTVQKNRCSSKQGSHCSSIDKEDCCQNKSFSFQFDQDKQQLQIFDFVVNTQLQQFVTAYVMAILFNDFSIESDIVAFAHYKPPLIERDIPVLIQSFLI